MTRQLTHKGKKLHYAIREWKTGKVRCVQKDCKKNHTKSLMITLSCGCQKIFNDSVLGWTGLYNTGKCKTRRHGNPKSKASHIDINVNGGQK